MAKVYSYPRVTMSTLAKKHSHNVVNVPDTTILFAPLVTEKGPTDKLVKVHSLSEFIDVFGSLNEEFYDLNGQMALNVYNWLSNGGTLFVKRIVIEDYVAKAYSDNEKCKDDGEHTFEDGKCVTCGCLNIKNYVKSDVKITDGKEDYIVLSTDASETEKLSAALNNNVILIDNSTFNVDMETADFTLPTLVKSELAEVQSLYAEENDGVYTVFGTDNIPVKYVKCHDIIFERKGNDYIAIKNLTPGGDVGTSKISLSEHLQETGSTGSHTLTGSLTLKDGDLENAATVYGKLSGKGKYFYYTAQIDSTDSVSILTFKIVSSSYYVKAKYEGRYYAKLELFVERVSPAAKDGIYNFIVNYVDDKGRKTSLEKFAQKTLKTYKTALSASNYISLDGLSIEEYIGGILTEKGRTCSFKLNSVAVPQDKLSYKTKTISKLKSFWSEDAGEVKNNVYIHNDSARYYLSNRLETPVDLILDAGYDNEIKSELVKFVNNAEDKESPRPDIVLILDAWSLHEDLKLAGPSFSGIYQDLNGQTFHPTNIAVYEQYFTINDAIFTNQDLYVTPTYFLSKLLPYNDDTYGMQYPTAGLRRGILADALYVNENPDAERKEEWFVERVNYVEKSAREYAFMSQRTLDGSTDMEYTALSFLNNERVLEKIKKEIEALARSYLHEFNDSVTIANMTNVLNKYVANWIANRTLSLGVVEVVQNAVSENALDINLNIRFTNTIEVINVSIVIE